MLKVCILFLQGFDTVTSPCTLWLVVEITERYPTCMLRDDVMLRCSKKNSSI